jgi:hypothetical protein
MFDRTTVLLLGAAGVLCIVLLVVPFVTLDRVGPASKVLFLVTLVIFIGLSLLAVVRMALRTNRRDSAFFAPALARADDGLRAIASRTGGTYAPGATNWMSYSYGFGQFRRTEAPSDFIGAGSTVRYQVHGLDVEVRSSIEEFGDALVLAPRVLITLGPQMAWRTDAFFGARIWPPNGASRGWIESLPGAAAAAYRALGEVSSRVIWYPRYLDVRGLASHAVFDEAHEVGSDDFEPDSILSIVDRAGAFARAAAFP